MNLKEKYSQKLLVEGIDDYHVMMAICRREEIAESFDVVDSGGFPDILEKAKLRFKTSNLTTLGIVVDADMDQSVRWKELKRLLEHTGYEVPDDLPSQGLILLPPAKIRLAYGSCQTTGVAGCLKIF